MASDSDVWEDDDVADTGGAEPPLPANELLREQLARDERSYNVLLCYAFCLELRFT
jgi:hypothetical protein